MVVRMIRLKHLPLDSIQVNSPYGQRNITVNDKYFWWHNGLDLKTHQNAPVYAVADGKVITAAYDNSYGYYVTLDHGKCGTLYAHLSRYDVKAGDSIKSGNIIGYAGSTGDSTGPHLHFEIRLGSYEKFWERAYCDKRVFMNTTDPMLFIEELLKRQSEFTVDEAVNIVQSAAGLEDKTMNYISEYYKFGHDLVKKLAKALI